MLPGKRGQVKGIVITTENEISIKDFGEDYLSEAKEVIGGWPEHCHPRLLPEPLCMFVDDEGLRKELPISGVGSFLYGTLAHGHPIVGTIVILKDEGPNIVGLTDEEINTLCGWLLRTFKLRGDITL